MAEEVEVEVKIREGTACGACGIEIEGNETRKDCNAPTSPARAGVRVVFFCRRGRSSAEEESSSTLGGSQYSYGVAISVFCQEKAKQTDLRMLCGFVILLPSRLAAPANSQIQESAQQNNCKTFLRSPLSPQVCYLCSLWCFVSKGQSRSRLTGHPNASFVRRTFDN